VDQALSCREPIRNCLWVVLDHPGERIRNQGSGRRGADLVGHDPQFPALIR
jgi:hypothetical protein